MQTGTRIINAVRHEKALLPLVLTLTACASLTIVLDVLEARFQKYPFHLSESFLFSSFWWPFLPIIYGQIRLLKRLNIKYPSAFLALTVLSISTHLLLFPGTVWSISRMLFEHTYAYWQIFQYGAINNLFIVGIIYTVTPVLYRLYPANNQVKQVPPAMEDAMHKKSWPEYLIVLEGTRHVRLSTQDIVFISSNTPYINVHDASGKYLSNETLTSISKKLDDQTFLRVHKSTIVNVAHVSGYKSRQNGDYDLTMTNGAILRLSRNYATDVS